MAEQVTISHAYRFSPSPLLGARAENVYSWFLKSLEYPGDVAECGVFRGETSRELATYLEEIGSDKILHMFDSFEGFPEIFTDEERLLAVGQEIERGKYRCPLEETLRVIGPLRRYKLHKGLFSETFATFSKPLCFVHADADLYESTAQIIRLAYRCLVPGGHIVFDDYGNQYFPGVRLAVDRHLSLDDYIITPSIETIQCFATKRS
jgi:O-methyltransferase